MSAVNEGRSSRQLPAAADLVDALLCAVAALCAVAGYLMYYSTLTGMSC